MKAVLFAGICALAFSLTSCDASDPTASSSSQATAPTQAITQPTQRVAGVPAAMLVPSPRAVTQGSILGEADLQQLLIGNTIKQVDDQYWAYFGAGGQLRGLLVNLTEAGSYSLAGGQVCKAWPTWAAGMRLCYRVLDLGQSRYRFSGIGVDSFDVVVSRGNPQAL